jgi:hypothetical protein
MAVVIGCLFVASFLVAQDIGKGGVDGRSATASVPASSSTSQASQPATSSQSSSGGITGKVVRERVAVPVANAKVSLLNAKRQPIAAAQSDANGDFVFKDVPAGKGYIVRAFDGSQRAGAEGSKRDVSVEANKVTDVGNIAVYALPG